MREVQLLKDSPDRFELIQAMQNEWMPFIKSYEMVLVELESDFKILDLEWNATYGYSPIEHIKTRLKNPTSLIKKIESRNIIFNQTEITKSIKDIAGIRIVTGFIEDVYMMLEHIKQREDLRITQIKDYIENPKPSGYRSLHIIVESKVILSDQVVWVPAEIQVRTLSMDFWASLEHKLQYKYKNSGEIPDIDKQLLKDVAMSSFENDIQMSLLRQKLLAIKYV
ncbi:MAG TPA: GTP pyrophosphokinase family protein [Epulopiscium sp.]|nr:GTP pyrophosphokinase family protein [Candidatus Epulonipiscium sp.]